MDSLTCLPFINLALLILKLFHPRPGVIWLPWNIIQKEKSRRKIIKQFSFDNSGLQQLSVAISTSSLPSLILKQNGAHGSYLLCVFKSFKGIVSCRTNSPIVGRWESLNDMSLSLPSVWSQNTSQFLSVSGSHIHFTHVLSCPEISSFYKIPLSFL